MRCWPAPDRHVASEHSVPDGEMECVTESFIERGVCPGSRPISRMKVKERKSQLEGPTQVQAQARLRTVGNRGEVRAGK